MSKKLWKWFWVWDFEKEEKWLNDMAAQGWRLCEVGYAQYTFEECEPQSETIRLELLKDGWNSDAGREYVRFVEGTGATCIGHVMNWAYFRKKASEGGFELFSDLDSRVKHINTILALVTPITMMNVINWINILNSKSDYSATPKVLSSGIVALCLYGCMHLVTLRKRLETERQLHE